MWCETVTCPVLTASDVFHVTSANQDLLDGAMNNCWSLHHKRREQKGRGSSYKLTEILSVRKLTINCPRGSRLAPGSRAALPAAVLPLPSHSPPTCVEDTGNQGRRCGLIQEQFPHHHPGGVPGKPPLQEAHPEVVEVAMETERHHGDVPRVAPVHFLPPREPLVDVVPPGEQAAVQCNVGDPRKPTNVSQKRLSHYVKATVTPWNQIWRQRNRLFHPVS